MSDASAFLPVIGTAVEAWTNERNLEENANQARLQREWNEKMWNKNNEYNTPSAQKQRLEDAGINPYSVLAQGGANTGISSSPAQSYDRAQANFVSPFASSEYISGLLAMQDYKLKQVDIDKGHADMEFYRIRQVKEMIKTDAEISEILSNRNLTDEQRRYLENQREVLKGSIQSLITKNDADSRVAYVTADNLQRQFNDAHNESVLKQASLDAGLRLSRAQISQLNAEIKRIGAEIGEINARTDLTKQQKENLIDELKTNARNRNSSRLHDYLGMTKDKAAFWKQINDMIDDASTIEVPFGSIKLPRSIVGKDQFRHIYDDVPFYEK